MSGRRDSLGCSPCPVIEINWKTTTQHRQACQRPIPLGNTLSSHHQAQKRKEPARLLRTKEI